MGERRRPNLIVAGVNKAGTTSLFAYLAQHPAVSPARVKETCYFLPLRYGEPLAPLASYLDLFDPDAHEPWLLEATPGYFYGGEEVAAAIDATLPGARIVIVLRDPVERLVSFMNFQKSRLLLDPDLTLSAYVERCLELDDTDLAVRANNPWFGVAGGLYDRWLPVWTERFGDRLRLLLFERFRRDPRGELESICEWLGIDPAPCRRLDLRTENRTTGFRLARLQSVALATNDRFERFFRSHPGVKAALRRLYYAVNAAGFPTAGGDDEARRRLHGLYEQSNRAVARLVRERGVAELPGWLAGASARGRGPAGQTG